MTYDIDHVTDLLSLRYHAEYHVGSCVTGAVSSKFFVYHADFAHYWWPMGWIDKLYSLFDGATIVGYRPAIVCVPFGQL
jgi:hypothetical protein